MEPRSAELVIMTPDGTLLGCLPPIPVATPWWQETEPVVQAVQTHYGIHVTILRLLSAQNETPHGGEVTYLAETTESCKAIKPWLGKLDEQPLRQTYAMCGGPKADLAWAEQCLIAHGYTRTAPPVQIRSWGLSSLWRIPTAAETLWLKVVPPFFAHEGKLLERLAGQKVPSLLGHKGGRMLLAEISGEDLYQASPEQVLAMIALLVEIQASFIGREQELLDMGLPDWRLPALSTAMTHVLQHTKKQLAPDDVQTLEQFIERLPQLAGAIDACGLPPTLVHGDFHSGNVRGTGLDLTVLDWGDSGLGHPLLDQAALLKHLPENDADKIRNYWHSAWRQRVPESNPERAALFIRPLAAVRQAMIYQKFLDNVEPVEHAHYRSKPAWWLSQAAALYRELADRL